MTGAQVEASINIAISVERCVGCLQCVEVCRAGALHLMAGARAIDGDLDRCTACRRCVQACPFGAIEVTGQPRNRHQLVLDSVRAALASTCPQGWNVTTKPPAFWVAPGVEPVAPDLAVVRSPRPGVEWLSREDAVVSLAVEIVSPKSREIDLGQKRDLYWRGGVTSYWTVHQQTGRVDVQWTRAASWFDQWARFAFG